jgi:HD-GYP domain-containing protein (c-di-GMP phosphodiesterase class II)
MVGRILKENVYTEDGQLLLAKGIRMEERHIQYLRQRNIVLSSDWFEESREEIERKEHYQRTVERVKQLFQQVAEAKLPPLLDFYHVFYPLFHKYVQSTPFFWEIYELEGTDEYTYRHSINVGILSGIIAKIMGMNHDAIEQIGLAGFFHDMGKLKISPDLLLKREKLTVEEFEEMKRHTIYGYDLLAMLTDDVSILDGALYHHERMDGSGYPYGIAGEQIPEVAQIIAVADVFDAVSSNRAYKTKKSIYYAANILESEMYGQKLNPTYVIPFLKYLSDCFVGQRAIFADGREGNVILCFPDEPLRPLVLIEGECYDLRKERQIVILDILYTA